MSGYKRKRLNNENTKVEVLDEGYVKKRKNRRLRPERCHKDDEKNRRMEIAEQFNILRSFMPPTRKTRTRQELLSVTRELIWEMWRNEEILALTRKNEIQSKISELEKLLVMKRDKKKQLQLIKQTASNTTMTEHIAINEEDQEGEEDIVIDQTSMMIEDEPAHILIDHELTVNEGIVLEEVLPPELYYQLANDELNKLQCLGDVVDLSKEDEEERRNEEELKKEAEVVEGMLSVETIDNKDSDNDEEEEEESNKDQDDQGDQNKQEYIIEIPKTVMQPFPDYPPRIYSEDENIYNMSKFPIPLPNHMLFYPGILPSFHLYPPFQDFTGLPLPPVPAYNIPQPPPDETPRSLIDQLLTAASESDLSNNNVDVVN